MTSWRALKHFCTDAGQYGLNIAADSYVDDGIRMIRTTDAATGGGLTPTEDGVFVPPSAPELKHQMEDGDLLLSRSGSLGKYVHYRTAMGPATFAGFLVRFRPRSGVLSRYLAYCFESSFFTAAIESEAVSSTISNFNAERYANVRLPWWGTREQRAIADFLDTETARIAALIDKKRRLSERLVERRTGVIDRLFEQQPICPRLSRLLIQSPCYGVLKPDRYEGDDAVPCLRISEIKASGDLDLTEAIAISPTQHAEYRRTRLSRGDVLLSCVGTLGRAAVVGEETAGANVSRAVARLVPQPGLDPRYLCLWTESSEFRRAVDLVVNVTAQPVLNMGDLASMKVPMPEKLDETRRLSADIGAVLAPIEEARAKLARQMTLLKEHRQALITAAVTGKLEVPGVAA